MSNTININMPNFNKVFVCCVERQHFLAYDGVRTIWHHILVFTTLMANI